MRLRVSIPDNANVEIERTGEGNIYGINFDVRTEGWNGLPWLILYEDNSGNITRLDEKVILVNSQQKIKLGE